MSEENITEGDTPTEAPSPSLDLDQTIQVNGEQVSIQDLLASRQRANELEEYKKHASQIMRGEGGMGTKEESTRYIMTQEGYTPDQIEEYVQASKQYEQQMQQPQEPQPQEPTPADDRVASLEQRLSQTEQMATQQKLDAMKATLKAGVDQAAASQPIKTILEASKRINGDNDLAQTELMLKQDIERETLALLKRERAATGKIADDSFPAQLRKQLSLYRHGIVR